MAADSSGIVCVKRTPWRAVVDARVENNTFVAQGDNCEGLGNEQNTPIMANGEPLPPLTALVLHMATLWEELLEGVIKEDPTDDHSKMNFGSISVRKRELLDAIFPKDNTPDEIAAYLDEHDREAMPATIVRLLGKDNRYLLRTAQPIYQDTATYLDKTYPEKILLEHMPRPRATETQH